MGALRICLLASGSNGNACFVEADDVRVLIDAGIGPRVLAARLAPLGLAPTDITHLLLTHGHHDHVAGVAGLVKRQPQLRVVATPGAVRDLPAPVRRRLERLTVGRAVTLGPLTVTPVAAAHDAAQPVCFRIEAAAGTVGYATDLGRFGDEMIAALSGAEVLIVESNHCPLMLATGPYPARLKRRVAGPFGHLSNRQCRELLERLHHGRLREVVLAHLSEVNNAPEAVWAELRELVDSSPTVRWTLGSRTGALEPILLEGRAARPAPGGVRGAQLTLPVG